MRGKLKFWFALVTSIPEVFIAFVISSTVASGKAERTTANAPATWGVAIEVPLRETNPPPALAAPLVPPSGISFADEVNRFETDLILQALEHTHWNKRQAAHLLRMNRTTLTEKIKRKGLLSEPALLRRARDFSSEAIAEHGRRSRAHPAGSHR